MIDPVTGATAPPRIETSIGDARQPPGSGPRGQGAGGAGAGPPGSGIARGPDAAVQLAADLLQLPPGTVLDGLIAGPDAEGRPTIATNAGLFALVTAGMPLPSPGSRVSLQVTGAANLLSVLLTTATGGGRPAAPLALDLSYIGGPVAPEAPAGGDATTRPLFQATQNAPDGRPLASLALRLGAPALPGAPLLAATVTVRQALPDGSVTLVLAAADGSTVEIPDAPRAIAVGTRLLFEVASRIPVGLPSRPEVPVARLPTLAAMPEAVRQFAAGRTALADLDRLLAGDGGETSPLARLLPGLGQEQGQGLAVALLGAALRFKDFKRLLGEDRQAAATAKAGPGPLLRAGAEFAELAKAATDTAPAQGWRPIPLPFFDGREIQPVVIFVQHHEPETAAEEVEDETTPRRKAVRNGTRFMVSLALSELGAVQIDGFAKPERIDTVLRSGRAIAADLRDELATRYTELMETAGLAGTLSFQIQEGPRGPLSLDTPDLPPAGVRLSITA